MLRRGSDFDVVEAMAAASGLKRLEGHFTPSLNTYTPSQAFWLALVDEEDRMVGRVCARFDRMAYPMTLTDFWRKYFHRCYPDAEGGKVVLSDKQPRVGRRITGDVVYLAERKLPRSGAVRSSAAAQPDGPDRGIGRVGAASITLGAGFQLHGRLLARLRLYPCTLSCTELG